MAETIGKPHEHDGYYTHNIYDGDKDKHRSLSAAKAHAADGESESVIHHVQGGTIQKTHRERADGNGWESHTNHKGKSIDHKDLHETASADTLRPGAGSVAGDVGRTEMMAAVVSAMGGMSKQEINKFQEVLDQYGKNKIPGAKDNSSANMASIAAKGAMKEDIEDMLASDDLSEEFREKAATIFEAAVSARVGLEVSRIEEEFEEAVAEVSERLQEELSTKVDSYLDYVAEQWFEENRIAIESSFKLDAAESFMESMKALFAEHNVEVPEEDFDVVEALEFQVADLEDKLNEEINSKIELQRLVEDAEREAIFDEVSEGLAETQVEKLRTLAEGLDFANAETYRKKVSLVKENYFTGKTETSTSIMIEEATAGSEDELFEETLAVARPDMQKYVSAITKTSK